MTSKMNLCCTSRVGRVLSGRCTRPRNENASQIAVRHLYYDWDCLELVIKKFEKVRNFVHGEIEGYIDVIAHPI